MNKYIDILKKGKKEWNEWRDFNQRERPYFPKATLDGLNLEGYNLSYCEFYYTHLKGCNLNNTSLAWATFFHCKLNNSEIRNPEAENYLDEASFQGVNIRWASFDDSDLQHVNMKGALFEGVSLINCKLQNANISYSRIHGLSAWGNEVDASTIQNDLIITPHNEPTIRVDNFEVAQFLYLLISNRKIGSIIDTLATKVVFILGSFAANDKKVLDEIKIQLSCSNYIPVIFDFDKPFSRNFTETVSTIAHFAKFIIADLTNSKSIAHELSSIIPRLTSVPVIPIIKEQQTPYSMFEDFKSYNHISKIITYGEEKSFINLVNEIIASASRIIKEIKH